MTPAGKSKKELIQLCGQLRETVDQLESGISGRRKRNRRSGAADRSRKTQKRKAASANALSNVRTDNTTMTSSVADASTNLIAPSPVKGVSLIQEAVEEKEPVDKEKEDDDVAAKKRKTLPMKTNVLTKKRRMLMSQPKKHKKMSRKTNVLTKKW